MTDLNDLISQVRRNCIISDARYWGDYTICNLLLGLKEQYKFENKIMPWEDVKKEAILSWIAEREKLWAELEGEDFIQLNIRGKDYSAFDGESINNILITQNIFYGAGYGRRLKPSFFLAELNYRGVREGCSLYITGKELSRDMAAYPAMLQDEKIIIRSEVILLLIWDKFYELQSNKFKSSLSFAFNYYGIRPDEEPSEALHEKFRGILSSEIESYVYHEVGEFFEGKKLGGQWKDFLSSVSNCKAELMVRGIKDLLADTSEKGMLRYIIAQRNAGALAFYVSSLRGYRKSIFKEMPEAFQKFSEKENWEEIERAKDNCYKRLTNYAGSMLAIYGKEPETARLIGRIEKEFSHLL